jgi:hypothetical protein
VYALHLRFHSKPHSACLFQPCSPFLDTPPFHSENSSSDFNHHHRLLPISCIIICTKHGTQKLQIQIILFEPKQNQSLKLFKGNIRNYLCFKLNKNGNNNESQAKGLESISKIVLNKYSYKNIKTET